MYLEDPGTQGILLATRVHRRGFPVHNVFCLTGDLRNAHGRRAEARREVGALRILELRAAVLDGRDIAAVAIDGEDQWVGRAGINDIIATRLGKPERGPGRRGEGQDGQEQNLEKHIDRPLPDG